MTDAVTAPIPSRRDGPALALAVAAAFASAILAISEHAEAVEQGYRLAAARREGEVLLREALRAERKVSILSIPTSVAQRAAAMRLGLEHPRDRRVLSHDQVTALIAPPIAAGSTPPTAAPGAPSPKPPIARPPEGMSK